MFDKEYSFRGSHAEKVNKLTAPFNKDGNKMFSRNLDVYLVAPIIGFTYSRKATIDKSDPNTKIFVEQLMNVQLNLWFNYRLIMILDASYEPNFDERINKSFKYYSTEKAKPDEILFDNYVLGGVEVLYEKIIESAHSEEYFLMSLYDFLEEFYERYNEKIDTNSILDLCKLARE